MLEGDKLCKNLLSISIYNFKPIYFISNFLRNLKYISKQIKIFKTYDKKIVCKKFLIKIAKRSNHNVNSIDFLNKIRGMH